jgi:aryl-alcohol dehydrogenase-like predicted oxidoreductase
VRYVEVGGVRVSAVGLGTWQFGSRDWGYGDAYANETAMAITHRALELGITFYDTAEIYGFGNSERILGRALAGRRAEAFVATKILPILPLSAVVQQRAVASAVRLSVESIDLYQVHWPNPVVPLARTMAGMSKLQRTGLVKHVGVSNFGLARWQAAERALGGPVLSNQVQYNLVQRKPEDELVPWAQANGRLIIAYSPLAQGFLSGRYDASHRPSGSARAMNALFLADNLSAGEELLGTLREIATSHGATPAQVALAWLIRKPNVMAIPGASSVAQLEANAAAADIELSEEDNARLTDASDGFHPRTGKAALPDLVLSRLRR